MGDTPKIQDVTVLVAALEKLLERGLVIEHRSSSSLIRLAREDDGDTQTTGRSW